MNDFWKRFIHFLQSGKSTENFVYLMRPTFRRELAALISLLLILFVIRFKLFASFGSAFLGGYERDSGLYLWLIKSNLQNLLELPWFNTTAFFPYTRSLAWSDNFILPSFFCWPFLAAGLSFAAAYNILILSANFLNGYAVYLLASRLYGKIFPALIGGAAFMSFSYLTGHLGHPQLQFAFWIPLALYFLMRFFSKPGLLSAILVGFTIFLCFLSTVYYAIFAVVAVFCIIAAFALLRPAQLKPLEYTLLFSGMLMGFLPCLFFIFPYFDVRNTFGERQLYEAFSFSANALSYLSASPLNFIYGATSTWAQPETNLFPGFTVLFLALLALRRTAEASQLKTPYRTLLLLVFLSALFSTSFFEAVFWKYSTAFFLWATLFAAFWYLYKLGQLERRLGFHIMSNRGIIASFLFAGFVFYAISLGPLGKPIEGQFAPGIFRVFYELMPGMNSIRAIGRAGIFCVLFFCLVLPFPIALGIERKKFGLKACLLILVLVVVENYHTHYPIEGKVAQPAVIAELRKTAAPGDAAIAIPFTSVLKPNGTVKYWSDFARRNVNYMQWFLPTDVFLVNGYSGQRSKIMLDYPRKMSGFPDQRSINALALLPNLRFIVFCPEALESFDADDFEKRTRKFSNQITLLSKGTDGSYLFEFSERSRLNEEFYIRAPSFPAGQLNLELMSLSNTGDEEVLVDVYMKKHFEQVPFVTIPVKTDGAWSYYSFQLPETPDRVRPLLVTFKPREDSIVYLQNRKWNAVE